jgi:hypothetical protein
MWATVSENHSHKIIHGTNLDGEKNPMSMLCDDNVKDIIMRYAKGEKSASLGNEYGVSYFTILAIVSGRTWKHIQSEYRELAKQMTKINMNRATTHA